jgi:hypothetical protein
MCSVSPTQITTGKGNKGLPLVSLPDNDWDKIFNPAAGPYNRYRGSINEKTDPPKMPVPDSAAPLPAAPLPPAPDWSSEPLLNARKRARSLLSAAGGASGDMSLASTGTTYAKATLGA